MSANDGIVIVDETDGTFSVWYDGCVDNPFPTSASLIAKNLNELDAWRAADEVNDMYVEYGILKIVGPTAKLEKEALEYCNEQGWDMSDYIPKFT